MNAVSLPRLYVLRATYLLLAVGLALMVGPGLLRHSPDLEHMRGVVWAHLGAVGLLSLLGLRYPLQMLPLLFFELVWKAIWIVAIGLPRWQAGTLDGAVGDTWFECWFGVAVCVVAIPWKYVLGKYVRRPGDSWRRGSAGPS